MIRWTTAALGPPLLVAASLSSPASGRAADCNQNGADDIADLAGGASRDCNSNLVPDECELASGAVAYEARTTFHTGFASSIVAEDFDGDGDRDLVTGEFHGPGQAEGPQQDRAVVFLRNLGGGRFGSPERYPVSDKPYTVYADDLDGDGDLDLLVRLAEIGELWIYLNHGDATFSTPATYAMGGYFGAWKLGSITADIDGDGDPDVVVSSPELSQLSILLNQGDGSFLSGASVAVTRPRPYELGDIDADGDLDIVAGNASSEESPRSTLIVLPNAGDGTFPGRVEYDLGTDPGAIVLPDLDADGDLDCLVARDAPADSGLRPDVGVFLNRGSGTLDSGPPLQPGFRTQVLKTADVDGDGHVDVLLASDARIVRDRDSLAVFLSRGDGTFLPPAYHLVGDHPTQLEVLDVNGDARPEILALNYFGGSLSVLRNAGGGVFDEAVEFPIIGGPGPSMVCADLDADGDTDVATASFSNDDSIGILENIAGGEFTQGCREFLRGDVNADGALSLSDIIMLRRWFFDGGTIPACFDAADASDNDELNLCDAIAILDVLLRNPGWSQSLAEPSLEPGPDPTPFGAEPPHRCDGGNTRPTLPLGCLAYDVVPPRGSPDLLEIGDATAVPGATVQLPISLTAALSIDAVQLVVSYDPSVLVVDPENALSFESTYFEIFDAKPFGMVSVDAENGLLVAGIAGDLIQSGREIAPGADIVIAWLNLRVKDDATSQRVPIDLSNGPNDAGVGPYHLRNELTHRGEARFASFIPRRNGAILGIVGDQTLFVRGDSNGDQKVDLSDAVRTLGALFLERIGLSCDDAGDANDDGLLNISDPIFTLDSLFRGGQAMPQPFPQPGGDPTGDELFCFPPSPGN